MKGVQLLKIIVLCAVSAVCNAALSHFVINVARLPLYQDTVFTVAMCFTAGLFAGFLTGAFSCFCISFVYIYILGISLPKVGYLFYICVIVEVLLVCFFHSKLKKREEVFLQKPSLQSFIYVAPLLLGLAALDCIAVSITGGIIDFALTIHQVPRSISPEDTFKLGLLQNNMPLLATAVLSRIPINIVDRFIAIFGGYGVSLLYRKWIKNIRHSASPQ
jgi:energy-coupling factor transport system substrate-specific component